MYQVSNLGRVKSLNYRHTGREKMLKLSVNNKGYIIVKLWKNRKFKSFRLHRLVAEAFIPNPNNLPFINHKSEIKTQNNVENLEWCDAKYNLNYGTRKERVAEKTTNGKCSKPVFQYDLNGNFIKEWPSTMEVERQLGISHISECCLGKRNTCGGFKWKYK